jgi:hypothetical protein
LDYINEVQRKFSIEAQFTEFSDWEDFLILSRELKENDALMVIMSRKSGESFNPVMQKLPKYLNKYFSKNNFILVYPIQNGLNDPFAKTGGTSFLNPLLSGSVHTLESFSEAIGKVFKKK